MTRIGIIGWRGMVGSVLMQRMQEEMTQLGATFESRGDVDEHPYFLVKWPDGGPRKNVASGHSYVAASN